MPLTPSFTANQIIGFPSQIVLVDTSSGSDVAITQKRVYLTTAAGTFLVPTGTTTEYIAWTLASGLTKTIDALEKDRSLLIAVQWLSVSNVVLYTASQNLGFTLWNEESDYANTQSMAGNPKLINDNNYFANKSKMRECIDSGNQAISFAADLLSAQLCYDKATAIRLSSQYYFNNNS